MTRVPDDFLWMAEVCRELGYTEVNLNVGCPSGTVTAKGKGAGMLQDPEGLDRFLDSIFSASVLPISVKTRIGMENTDNWSALLEVYNRYPIKELTVHPRVRKAFYSGTPDMDAFTYAVQNSKNPLCYNGDILSLEQASRIQKQFPNVDAVMIGRGLIAKPDMLCSQKASGQTLLAFYEALLSDYLKIFGGSRNAMFRLKEHWHYLLPQFPGCEKLGKRLQKTTDLEEYRTISREILLSNS
jgi:tRNA-dihydrouridine synthase